MSQRCAFCGVCVPFRGDGIEICQLVFECGDLARQWAIRTNALGFAFAHRSSPAQWHVSMPTGRAADDLSAWHRRTEEQSWCVRELVLIDDGLPGGDW